MGAVMKLMIVAFPLWIVTGYARTIIVAKSGGDYGTITVGVNMAQAGDTVVVRQGTYDESVSTVRSGNDSALIVIQTYPGDTVVMTGGFTISHNYIELRGFEFSGVTGSGISIGGSHDLVRDNYIHHGSKGGGIALGGSYNTARYNRVANCGAEWGSQTSVNGSYNIFEYNDVSDPEGRGEDLMYFGGTGNIIRNNHLHHSIENGRHNDIFQCGGSVAIDILFQNNYIHHIYDQLAMMQTWTDNPIRNITFQGNVFCGIYGGYGNLYGYGIEGISFINNTFIGGRPVLKTGCTGIVMKNNVFYNRYPQYDGVTPDYHDYNLIYPDPTGEWLCPPKGSNDIWGLDPLFTNQDGLDFHLQAVSPAKNAGMAGAVADTDMDGTIRGEDGAWDMGAYEYTGTAIRTTGTMSPLFERIPDLPNPVGTAFMNHYRSLWEDMVVYDMNGAVIAHNDVLRPGIYLVRQADRTTANKITVAK